VAAANNAVMRSPGFAGRRKEKSVKNLEDSQRASHALTFS
jgi:hypothetical protein